jgi:hypothetical protein
MQTPPPSSLTVGSNPPVHFSCKIQSGGPGTGSRSSGFGLGSPGLATTPGSVGGSQGILTISSDAQVYCPDPSLKSIYTFQLDSAFGQASPLPEAFRTVVQPLVATTLRGHNSVCVVVGDDAAEKACLVEGQASTEPAGGAALRARTPAG